MGENDHANANSRLVKQVCLAFGAGGSEERTAEGGRKRFHADRLGFSPSGHWGFPVALYWPLFKPFLSLRFGKLTPNLPLLNTICSTFFIPCMHHHVCLSNADISLL